MTHNSDDRVTVQLAVESIVFDAAAVSLRVGVQPDRQWSIGDARGKTGMAWERHGWVIETTLRSADSGGRSATDLIPIVVSAFERRIQPIVAKLALLRTDAELFHVIAIVANETPGIELSESFLTVLSAIGGTLQIDFITGD